MELTCDLAPGTASVPVLKMVLQPLVENSLVHGILESETGKGTISLASRTVVDGETPLLEIAVTDSGVGMSPGQLAGLLEPPSIPGVPGKGGYGLFNIDQRLRLLYGETAALRLESELGRGTRVTLRIPL